jgi:capsular exopolysaccharide synthesis family protein
VKAKQTAIALDPIKVIRQNILLLVIGGIVGVGVGIGAYFLTLKFFPRYTAAAVFECQAKIESAVDPESISAGQLEELEMFMKTQAFEMTRDPILTEAVNSREVRNDTLWAEEFYVDGTYDPVAAFLELKEEISCSAVPETFYLQLSMGGPVPEDLPIIINSVADVYTRQLAQQKRSDSAQRRQILESELSRLRTRRDQLEDAMATFLAEHDISVLEELASAEAMEMTALSNQLTQTQAGMEQAKQMRQYYESIYATEGIINYPETIQLEAQEHPRIAALQNQGVQLRAALRSASEQFGPQHRQVRALERQIRGLNDEIEAEQQSIMASVLSARLDQARQAEQQYAQTAAELNEKLIEARMRMRDLTSNLETYDQMSKEVETVLEQLDRYNERLSDLRLTSESSASDRVQQRGRATKPDKVSFPKPETMIPGVAILVLGLFVAYVFLREIIDQRVKSPADVVGVGKSKVLGTIPEASEDPSNPEGFDLAIKRQPQSVIAESIRQLRTPLLKHVQQADHKVILVAPASPGSGATSIIGNLAASCAALEMKVLVVDGNFRKPRLHAHFGLEATPGLADMLADDEAALEQCVQTSSVENLSVLPAGTAEQRIVERLGTKRFDRVLDQARQQYDLVLVDVAPGIVSGDSQLVANRVDASILIARAMQDKRGLVARLAGLLSDGKSEFLGVVVNGVRSSAGGYYRKNIQAMDRYQRQES